MPNPVRECKTGVYCIRNIVNNKRHVGSAAISLLQRINQHKDALRVGNHRNLHLQSSYNKYGISKFMYSILERVSPKECVVREQFYINKYNCFDSKYGYNKSPTAGSPLGVKHTEATKKKFSQAMYKRMQDPNEREKAGRGMRGKSFSEETLKKLSIVRKQTWKNPEFRNKVISANTGKTRTPEQRARISASLKGRKFSEEHRAKCGNGNRGRKQSAETIAKRVLKLVGVKRSQECKAKISATHRGKVRSQEWKDNVANGIRKSRATESLEERKKYGKANIGINRRGGSCASSSKISS